VEEFWEKELEDAITKKEVVNLQIYLPEHINKDDFELKKLLRIFYWASQDSASNSFISMIIRYKKISPFLSIYEDGSSALASACKVSQNTNLKTMLRIAYEVPEEHKGIFDIMMHNCKNKKGMNCFHILYEKAYPEWEDDMETFRILRDEIVANHN
jgi:hypothetical protein